MILVIDGTLEPQKLGSWKVSSVMMVGTQVLRLLWAGSGTFGQKKVFLLCLQQNQAVAQVMGKSTKQSMPRKMFTSDESRAMVTTVRPELLVDPARLVAMR